MTNYPTVLGTGGHGASSGQTYGYNTYTYSNVGLGRSAMESTPFITESHVQQIIRVKGTISYLSWRLDAAFDAPLTLTLNKNGSSSSLAVSISGTGWVTDNTDSVSVVDGDSLDFAAHVGTGTGTGDEVTYDGNFYRVSARFDSTDSTVGSAQLLATVGSTSISPTTTRAYVNFLGVLGSLDTTEINCQFYSLASGGWQNIACYVDSNGFNKTTTINTRIEGANGTMSISILGGASGYFEDTGPGNGDSVDAGNRLDYGFIASDNGNGASFALDWIGAHFFATDSTLCTIGGSQGGVDHILHGTYNTYYTSLLGGGSIPEGTIGPGNPTRSTGLVPYAMKASNYTNHVPDSGGAATFNLLKNGTSVLSISIDASQSGFITAAGTANFDVGDTCANQLTVTDEALSWASATILVQAD